MARKHQPLLVGGVQVAITGNGFRLIDRPGGREPYWYAAKRAVAKGFNPKTVRLHGNLDSLKDVEAMFARCNTLWAEMLEWLAEGDSGPRLIWDGTIGSLIRCYQADPKSTWNDLRYNTQRGYGTWFNALDRAAGKWRISALVGADLRALYRDVRKPKKEGGKPRERLAKAVIQSVHILLAYGRECGLDPCIQLSELIDGMEFRKENEEQKLGKAKPVPKVVMTYDQAEAIVRKGLEAGNRRWRSVALATAAQFEFTISQIDAIGYWMPLKKGMSVEGAIVRSGKIWRPGLRFEDFESGILDLARLKTGRKGQFDIAEYPLFQLALGTVPEAEREGPLVTDADGDPIRYRVFYGLYQKVAEAAGVPKEVWSARARHGGGTEARAAGAVIDDVADHLQKSDVEGTRRDYVVGNVETTRRVARKRVASRGGKAEG